MRANFFILLLFIITMHLIQSKKSSHSTSKSSKKIENCEYESSSKCQYCKDGYFLTTNSLCSVCSIQYNQTQCEEQKFKYNNETNQCICDQGDPKGKITNIIIVVVVLVVVIIVVIVTIIIRRKRRAKMLAKQTAAANECPCPTPVSVPYVNQGNYMGYQQNAYPANAYPQMGYAQGQQPMYVNNQPNQINVVQVNNAANQGLYSSDAIPY